MNPSETVLEGTIQPDGMLVLDRKPDLPAGRVTVVLRPHVDPALPPDDPFWQRMQAMWAISKAAGNATDGGVNSLAELQKMREEWDEHQCAVELDSDGKCQTRHCSDIPVAEAE